MLAWCAWLWQVLPSRQRGSATNQTRVVCSNRRRPRTVLGAWSQLGTDQNTNHWSWFNCVTLGETKKKLVKTEVKGMAALEHSHSWWNQEHNIYYSYTIFSPQHPVGPFLYIGAHSNGCNVCFVHRESEWRNHFHRRQTLTMKHLETCLLPLQGYEVAHGKHYSFYRLNKDGPINVRNFKKQDQIRQGGTPSVTSNPRVAFIIRTSIPHDIPPCSLLSAL